MKHLKIDRNVFRSRAYRGATDAERLAWLSLLDYCAEVENGGRIQNCRYWPAHRWLSVTGLSLNIETMHAHSPLLYLDDQDLIVLHYDTAYENLCKKNRKSASKKRAVL